MWKAQHKTNRALVIEVTNDQKKKIEQGKHTKGLYDFKEIISKKGKSKKPNVEPIQEDLSAVSTSDEN